MCGAPPPSVAPLCRYLALWTRAPTSLATGICTNRRCLSCKSSLCPPLGLRLCFRFPFPKAPDIHQNRAFMSAIFLASSLSQEIRGSAIWVRAHLEPSSSVIAQKEKPDQIPQIHDGNLDAIR